MSVLRDNERLKFQVNALDRASTALLAIGVLGPTIGGAGGGWSLTPLAWLAGAIALHAIGYFMLGRLRP